MSGDAGSYFAAKTALINLLDYFRRYHQAGFSFLPTTLTDEYGHVIAEVDAALAEFRARHIPPAGPSICTNAAYAANSGRR